MNEQQAGRMLQDDPNAFLTHFAMVRDPNDPDGVPMAIWRERLDAVQALYSEPLVPWEPTGDEGPTMNVKIVLGAEHDHDGMLFDDREAYRQGVEAVRHPNDVFADAVKETIKRPLDVEKVVRGDLDSRLVSPGWAMPDGSFQVDAEAVRLASANPDDPLWQQSPALAMTTIPPAQPSTDENKLLVEARTTPISQLSNGELLSTADRARSTLIRYDMQRAQIERNLALRRQPLSQEQEIEVATSLAHWELTLEASQVWHDRLIAECKRRRLVVETASMVLDPSIELVDGSHR